MEEKHETRAVTLKRDLASLAEDEAKQKARITMEPVVKRARIALTTTAQQLTEPPKPLSEEEKAEVEMVFQLFDKDKDGNITAEELNSVLRALGFRPTLHEVGAILKGINPPPVFNALLSF